MPSADALKNFSRLQLGAATDTTERLVTELPKVPEDVKKRFPSMAQFEERQKEWHRKLLLALRGGAQ
jgi:hypothetical protein